MRTSLGALFCLVSTQSLASAATLTVTTTSDLGSGSLRDAIRRAQDGDTIVFAPGVMGTITLDAVLEIRSSLTIAGPGASQLAISGDGAFRVFDLNEGHSVSISGLTITRGQSVEGSALRNHGSALRLADDVFIDNEAGGQYAAGGAIANYNRADLTITGCTFIGNRAMGKDGGGWARGGAIVNQRSSATISGSVFIGNEAAGGAGGQNRYGGFGPGLGAGGAIDNIDGASLTVLNCTFTDNHAAGGDRGDGGEHAALVGEGQGGALRNHDTSTLLLSGSWLSGNVATGGSSTTASGPARLGTARGGAIFNHGSARVVNSTFAGNEAVGGDGGMGSNATRENGTAVGGAILNSGAFDTCLLYTSPSPRDS